MREQNEQIGRYQMVGVHLAEGGLPMLYLLDTTNGQVWVGKAKNNWFVHDSWEPLITGLPR